MATKNLVFLFVLFLHPGLANLAVSDEISQEELERWFNSDTLDPPRYKDTRDVNEGDLVFLTKKPGKSLHYHRNFVTILPASLNDGWILIEQCHSNIDKVPAAQIVFGKNRVRNIKIISFKNIERAWVEGTTVQFENIKDNASICIQANTHSLTVLPDGTYKLRNGPFMRRFLDGYFPMHVSLDLKYGQTDLVLTSFSPHVQKGFSVEQRDGEIKIDTVFEGRLNTEFHFKTKNL